MAKTPSVICLLALPLSFRISFGNFGIIGYVNESITKVQKYLSKQIQLRT